MTTLKELRELAEAATPGPWERLAGDYGRRIASEPIRVIEGQSPIVCRVERDDPQHHTDAAFIVAAVNYVRSILQEGEQVAQPAETPGE